MKKRVIGLLLTVAMLATLIVPVMADNKESKNSRNTRNLTALQQLLKNYKNQKEKLGDRIKDEIERLIKLRDKAANKEQSKTLSLAELQKKLDEILAKMKAQDELELKRINEEKAQWMEHTTKVKSNLLAQIDRIKEALAKALTDLNKLLADAKTEEQKNKIKEQIAIKQKYADLKIAEVNAYIAALDAFWGEKQKLWETRIALLKNRQDLDYNHRSKMNSYIFSEASDLSKLVPATGTTTPATTDDQISASVFEKFKKQLDTLTEKIKELEAKIAALTAPTPAK